ncbi:hypothetical protein CORC01_10901 [Colletotrichum orchidophilum]|uniref:Uncharacterized protein n=1 Tax=Colletotrichum orchidophilum TaxID=1209926 RepID=A0A1G4AXD9_9PEZI|nr:uncharacterized protein CORC01_10901 [Colletotrichum orchidophilum]OHE93775.1 hypothetical protein CORC01_10901 [Colletotrichum orchidophilum]
MPRLRRVFAGWPEDVEKWSQGAQRTEGEHAQQEGKRSGPGWDEGPPSAGALCWCLAASATRSSREEAVAGLGGLPSWTTLARVAQQRQRRMQRKRREAEQHLNLHTVAGSLLAEGHERVRVADLEGKVSKQTCTSGVRIQSTESRPRRRSPSRHQLSLGQLRGAAQWEALVPFEGGRIVFQKPPSKPQELQSLCSVQAFASLEVYLPAIAWERWEHLRLAPADTLVARAISRLEH